jgi:hypothetical protein
MSDWRGGVANLYIILWEEGSRGRMVFMNEPFDRNSLSTCFARTYGDKIFVKCGQIFILNGG